MFCVSRKREPTRESLIKSDPKGPCVDFLPVTFRKNLRSNELRRTDYFFHFIVSVRSGLRASKINDLGIARFREHDVTAFEVLVGDHERVNMLKSLVNLNDNISDNVLFSCRVLVDDFQKLPTSEALHHKEDHSFAFVYLDELTDIGVVCFLQVLHFIFHTRDPIPIKPFLVYYFDRYCNAWIVL